MNLFTQRIIFPVLVLAVISVIAFSPLLASAAIFELPCEGVKKDANHTEDCNFEQLVELGRRIINAIFYLSIPIAAIVFAWAGSLYLTSAGNESKMKQGKSMFLKVLVGFVVILAAWLLINTILNVLVKPEFRNVL
jgi:hypothetical protein